MGMSTYVIGFRPPDDEYNDMLEVWRVCSQAGVSIPSEVRKFFGGDAVDTIDGPDPTGMEIHLNSDNCVAISEFHADMQDGFQIDLRLLSDDIKILRFVNTY